MQRHMILVCHAADGHFANGNRDGVRRVFEQSSRIIEVVDLGRDRYELTCADGGQLVLYAPGLDGARSFHRMEIFLDPEAWTEDMLHLILEFMRAGGFGLMESVEASQFIVALPQQVVYYPWLPEPPLLVRNPRDLAYTIANPVL